VAALNPSVAASAGWRIVAAGKHPFWLAAADFDSDGKLDLAVGDANDGENGGLSILLGNGGGTFQSSKSFSFDGGVTSLAVGDFDGDLQPDLALALSAVPPARVKLALLLSNGDGTFRRGGELLNVFGSILAADFNSDNKLDLVTGRSILRGNGDGTFQSPLPVSAIGLFVVPGSVGDFNGDGDLDLIMEVRRLHGKRLDSALQLLLGNSDGTFQAATDIFTIPQFAVRAATEDFDGDGKLDIVVTEHSDAGVVSQPVNVLLGRGDGTFQPAFSFDTESDPMSVSGVDLKGDRAPDLVTANTNDNTIRVLLNDTGADFSISASKPTPASINRGQSSTSTITLTHQNTFGDPVRLSCSVQPTQSAPTCTIDPNSVTFDASGNATATLTISTDSITASVIPSSRRFNAPSAVTLKPANGDQGKTGQ
jgi:large repetitive protein